MSPPRVVALVPARGGSKGLPGKNLATLCGQPLVHWSIRTGLASACIQEVVVSTEDPEIAKVARRSGASVPFMRPQTLALDDAPTMPVVFDLLDRLTCDLLVLLPPTSPLRNVDDVDGCIELALQSKRAVVSVCIADPPPAHMLVRTPEGIRPLMGALPTGGRRQDLEAVYALNGAVYGATPAALRAQGSFVCPTTRLYVMPKTRSIDVDDADDLRIAEALFDEGLRLPVAV